MRADPIATGTEPPLAVRRYNAGRYLVRSEQPGSSNWYLVDLTDPQFPRGRCSCVDYDIRIESKLKRYEEPERKSCKHVRRVLAELDHARTLCEAAGIPFSEKIIPTL